MVEAVQGIMSDEQGAIARRLAGWGTRLISSGQVRFVFIACICGLIVLLLVGWLARYVYQVRFFPSYDYRIRESFFFDKISWLAYSYVNHNHLKPVAYMDLYFKLVMKRGKNFY